MTQSSEKQEVDKKDVDYKAAEQIESSIDSNDAVAEKAKSLTGDDTLIQLLSKSVPNEAITEKDEIGTNKKDVDNIAAEQIEYSVDSKDAITEKGEITSADDITADSTSETKSSPK